MGHRFVLLDPLQIGNDGNDPWKFPFLARRDDFPQVLGGHWSSPSQGSKVFGEVFAVTVTLKFKS